MALDFPLALGPVFPVEKSVEPRVNTSKYGDGYQQRSGDGINIFVPETDVQYRGLTKAEHDLVEAFFEARAAQQGFMWQYPGDAAKTKWVCTKWKMQFIGVGNYGFTAHFERDFNPG